MTKPASTAQRRRATKPSAATKPRAAKAVAKPPPGVKQCALSVDMRRMLARYLREEVTALLLVGERPEAPSMDPRVIPSVRAIFPRDQRVGLSERVVETIGDIDTLFNAPGRPALSPNDGAVWRKLMLSMMPAAMLDALADVVACEDLRLHGGNPVSSIGHLMSVAIRRRILHDALEASSWRLSEVAKGLQLGGVGNLLRTIREVGLEPELERARAEGLVRRGGDRRSPAAKIKVPR